MRTYLLEKSRVVFQVNFIDIDSLACLQVNILSVNVALSIFPAYVFLIAVN